jgi:hypothetical protein
MIKLTVPLNKHVPSAPKPARMTFHEAADLVRPEAEALSAGELVEVNVNLHHASAMVLGRCSRLSTFRAQMLPLPDFDVDNLDRLELLAMNAAHAQVEYDANNQPLVIPPELINSLRKTQQSWVATIRLLASQGQIASTVLDRMEGRSGHRSPGQ